MSYYIPALDDFGDAALPLEKLVHLHRHSGPRIRPREADPLTEKQRFRILQAHCSKKGRRHDFSVMSTEGLKCLWCGITRAES